MKDKIKSTITVLWIEDNPTTDGLELHDLKKRLKSHDMEINFGDLPDNLPVPSIFFPSAIDEYNKYFTLKILQHPEEIKEYISMCLEIEDKLGSKVLGEMDNVVPDIIPFDYKLSEHLEINKDGKGNMKYRLEYLPLRRLFNPNFDIIEKFSDSLFKGKILTLESSEFYDKIDFLTKTNRLEEVNESKTQKDEGELENDEMGLYAGVAVTRQFRNHITVGIPVTANKSDIDVLGAHAKYYEWINEYDLGTMFRRSKKGSKKWQDILFEAVDQLRERIKIQVASDKIQPNLPQLIQLSTVEGIDKLDGDNERIFTFTSIYGERSLPLEGLFIDKNEGVERDNAIAKWAGELLTKITELTKITLPEYEKAIALTNKLWDVYTTIGKDFDKRQRLSELIAFQKSDEPILKEVLAEREAKEQLQELKDYFGVNTDNILTINYYELSDETDKIAKKLAVLFLYLKLRKQNQRLNENLEEINTEGFVKTLIDKNNSRINTAMTKRDLLMVLFPVKAKPLILDMHQSVVRKAERSEDKEFDANDSYIRGLGLKISTNCEISGFEGEKLLGRYFATQNGIDVPNFLM